MKEFLFTIGLPGSGKSTWLEKNCDNPSYIISADKIKEESYDRRNLNQSFNDFCEEFHEESVKRAEDLVYSAFDSGRKYVVMDGGGINRSYNKRIIMHLKNEYPHIKITGLYFNTPIEVCLNRLKQRNRQVPIDDIYNKNSLLPKMLEDYKEMGIEIKEIPYFTDEHVFFDMDGTLCELNDFPKDIHGDLDFVNCAYKFENAREIKNTMKYLVECWENKKNIYILTACANSLVWEAKLKWIEKNLDSNPKVFFVGNREWKHSFLHQYLIGKKIKPNQVLYIDDDQRMLSKMKEIGVNIKHVSQL